MSRDPALRRTAAGLLYTGTLNGVCVAAGLLLGRWLDGLAGTSALFTLVGIGLGIVCGGAGTVVLLRSYLRD